MVLICALNMWNAKVSRDATFAAWANMLIGCMPNITIVMQVVGKDIMPRPIMNVALTYDHRLIDGREAVTFLKRVKDIIEDPRRLMLDI